MNQFDIYLGKVLTVGKAFGGFLIGTIGYWVFPDESFETAAIAVLIAMILDIITKYVSLIKVNGGYIMAVRNGSISSDALWRGARVKIYAYAVVAIIIGLIYRVTMVEQVGLAAGTAIYSVLLLREVQSIIENLIATGADLGWLKAMAKKKEKEILKSEDEHKI